MTRRTDPVDGDDAESGDRRGLDRAHENRGRDVRDGRKGEHGALCTPPLVDDQGLAGDGKTEEGRERRKPREGVALDEDRGGKRQPERTAEAVREDADAPVHEQARMRAALGRPRRYRQIRCRDQGEMGLKRRAPAGAGAGSVRRLGLAHELPARARARTKEVTSARVYAER